MAAFVALLALILLGQLCTANVIREKAFSARNKESSIIEGDIMLDEKLKRIVSIAKQNKETKIYRRKKRDAVKYSQNIWKDAIVPYIIDDTVDLSTRNTIQLAMQEFHKKTCLWFIPRKNESDYIRIVSADGCYSKIGRQGGEQLISIGLGCDHKSTVMHELMHSIGFFHENTRFDRDYFVKVLWWNIQYGAEKNFLTYHHGKVDTLHMPYDINSLMHYNRKAFTKNFGDTLQAIDDPNASLGGKTFSKIDIKQILLLYHCDQPQYQRRHELCQDKHKTGCLVFLSYPEYCHVNAKYALLYCRKTCRLCEDPTAFRL